MGLGESGFNCWGVRGSALILFLFLSVCIWNAPVVLLVLQAFDNTSSLGSPPCQVVYPPGFMVPEPLVTASCILVENKMLS